jgi:phosphoribosylglycinamide formyltransferase-1
MIPIVVMASGTGSIFEAVAEAIASGKLQAEIRALVCDQPAAGVLEKARARKIRTLVVPKVEGETRSSHEDRILSEILPLSPRFLVMAGYMRIVSSKLLEAFRSERGYTRVVNIHPSLLPAFPGVGAYAQAFRYGCKVTGATVHLVEPEVDSGPICAQAAFSIEGLVSEAEVEGTGKALEREFYPKTLAWVLPEKFEIEMRDDVTRRGGSRAEIPRRLCVCPN